jgi:rifampicin phosphotransferase
MTYPILLPLPSCSDPLLVGGKAASLARLLATGFRVPPGCCVTTAAYNQALDTVGVSPLKRWLQARQHQGEDRQLYLEECRRIIQQVDVSWLVEACWHDMCRIELLPDKWLAVRSSATNEDAVHASSAGLYRSRLGVASGEIGQAIKDVWASLWDERVLDYMLMCGRTAAPPTMAVVIQPMVEAQVSGVAYSIHPVTGRDNQVMINAIRGLGAPLVDGSIEPNQYVIQIGKDGQPTRLRRRFLAQQTEQLVIGAEGISREQLSTEVRDNSLLSEQQLDEVAVLAKRIEQTFHSPVDLEWSFDGKRLWILQARPITAVQPLSDLTDDDCEWSRANFKETMPEVPSPMGLSVFEHFMDAYILSHYRRLGCRIPSGLSAVRTFRGRPYLNATLFHALVGQLRSDPSLNVEQMGGEPLAWAPAVKPLDWFAILRAAWLMWKEMRRVVKAAPSNFAAMRNLADTYSPDRVQHLSFDELEPSLNNMSRWLESREMTFGIVGGVGQCLQVFSLVLPSWLGEDWRNLLNASLQGQGRVVSAQQILHLAEMAEMARSDATVLEEMGREGVPNGFYRQRLQGTRFLSAFDRYLDEYGHRGLGESDVMSPRFADQPDALLDVIKAQVNGPVSTSAQIIERQRESRETALATIKTRCGWRVDRWLWFQWWYRRLCRFFALREANRHHLMFYSTAARNLLLRLGELLVEHGLFNVREDIFYVTLSEREELASNRTINWMPLIRDRRVERERWLTLTAPDTIRDWEGLASMSFDHHRLETDRTLQGLSISTGQVTGTVKFVRTTADWSKVQAGDIIVAPVIDPGMAPLFSIAGGLIVEMGGALSHGAIIAREYGLPAVVNVHRAMSILEEGELLTLNAGRGHIMRLNAASGP